MGAQSLASTWSPKGSSASFELTKLGKVAS